MASRSSSPVHLDVAACSVLRVKKQALLAAMEDNKVVSLTVAQARVWEDPARRPQWVADLMAAEAERRAEAQLPSEAVQQSWATISQVARKIGRKGDPGKGWVRKALTRVSNPAYGTDASGLVRIAPPTVDALLDLHRADKAARASADAAREKELASWVPLDAMLAGTVLDRAAVVARLRGCAVRVEVTPSQVTVVHPDDVESLREHVDAWVALDQARRRTAAQQRSTAVVGNTARKERSAGKAAALREAVDKVTVAVRERGTGPTSATIHLGPTNSGKTFDALARLAERGSGTFAGPLRMLAREAYEQLVEKVGAELVGLLTGEEEINPGAPIVCATAEMAPRHGDTLVLDEAHWAHDQDRGHAWTRLLVGAHYDTIEVAASAGTEPFLRAVLADARDLTVTRHDRLTPLSYAGTTTLANVPAKSLIVAFSRKAVLALAGRLRRAGRRVGVLYGALPPDARVDQIRRFVDGELDVMVTTDVIGHGVNVPAVAVVFAQTEKFDGTAHRELLLWEAAQIAGRAGRFGHTAHGYVYTLAREGAGFSPNQALVRSAAKAAAGVVPDRLSVTDGLVRPTFDDLGQPAPHHIGATLHQWSRLAGELLADRPGIAPVPVNDLTDRWQSAAAALRVDPARGPWGLTGQRLWQILTAPIDADSLVFPAMVQDLAFGSDRNTAELLARAEADAHVSLDSAEQAAATARDIMAVARAFEPLAHVHASAAAVEKSAAQTVSDLLEQTLAHTRFGVCTECGGRCAPWFSKCETCFQSTANRGYDEQYYGYASRGRGR